MNHIRISDDRVYTGSADLKSLAEKFGTPLYVYNLDRVQEMYSQLMNFFPYRPLKIYYAMKSNWNRDILKCLLLSGSGIDAVSPGDILMALKAGFSPDKILFTANHITDSEMHLAVSCGVLINIGSLSRLQKFACTYPGASVCLRFNPDVTAGEHAFLQTAGDLSKFGILLDDLQKVSDIVTKHSLKVVGLHEHTGSGISDLASFRKSMENLMELARFFPDLEFMDFGGGFKVRYSPDEKTVDYASFGKEISAMFEDFCRNYGKKLTLCFEPGKYLTADCGVLLVEVNTIKKNRNRVIAGVNSGLPHLIRPSFYGAYHHIINVSNPAGPQKVYDIAGNICESGDFFARERMISEIRENDVLAVLNAGSYCRSMASEYNLRPLPAEVTVSGDISSVSVPALSFQQLVERLYC